MPSPTDGGRVAARVRAEFPLLAECVYMNSNSTGVTPRGVERVLGEYWDVVRHWRDSKWETWWSQHRAYADAVAEFIGAPPGSVVTDANSSALLGRLATCFDYRGRRNRVVTSDQEFPSVPFLWRGFSRSGAELTVVPSPGGDGIDEDALAASIDERTLLVCVTHATFVTGALLDVKRIARVAHEVGAYVAIDAYQSVGTVPIDVEDLGVDFLLGGASKWLCGREVGFLFVRPELLESLQPASAGWMASANPFSFADVTEYAPDARRFAAGTPAVLGTLVSRVGLDIVRAVGKETIRSLSVAHTDHVIRRADEAGLRVRTPRDASRRGGIVSLAFPGDADVARELQARGFVCSYRGAVRVGPHFYNTEEEVEHFMNTLCALAREKRS